jgi:hypothetical protein
MLSPLLREKALAIGKGLDPRLSDISLTICRMSSSSRLENVVQSGHQSFPQESCAIKEESHKERGKAVLLRVRKRKK